MTVYSLVLLSALFSLYRMMGSKKPPKDEVSNAQLEEALAAENTSAEKALEPTEPEPEEEFRAEQKWFCVLAGRLEYKILMRFNS